MATSNPSSNDDDLHMTRAPDSRGEEIIPDSTEIDPSASVELDGLSSEVLMDRVRDEDDQAAFEVLYLRHVSDLRAHLNREIRHRHTAEDVSQDAFLRVWERRRRWGHAADGRRNFRGWLYRIAINLWWDRRRRRLP